jgi:integrase/recombinase XerD
MKTIVLESVNHKNENRLLLRFEKDEPLLQLLKQISGIKFSATHRAWHIANTKQNFNLLFTLCKGKAWLNYDALKNAPETKTTKAIPQHKIELEELNVSATQKIESI